MKKTIVHLIVLISICYGQHQKPARSFRVRQYFILHLDEIVLNVEQFLGAISEEIVLQLREFVSVEFTTQLDVEVTVEEQNREPSIERISFEFDCEKSNFQVGTAAELEAVVPGVQAKVAFTILKALAK